MPWSCCVCQVEAVPQVTYASVLVCGKQNIVDVHDAQKSSSSALANVSSYCVHCRRVTISYNTNLDACQNIISTQQRTLEYNQHKLFAESLPCKANFRKLLRKTSRKNSCSHKSRSLSKGCKHMHAVDLED